MVCACLLLVCLVAQTKCVKIRAAFIRIYIYFNRISSKLFAAAGPREIKWAINEFSIKTIKNDQATPAQRALCVFMRMCDKVTFSIFYCCVALRAVLRDDFVLPLSLSSLLFILNKLLDIKHIKIVIR